MERKKLKKSLLPEALIEKWNEEVLDEGYLPFPKRLLRCAGKIFHGPAALDDLRALLAVVDYRRPRLIRPPSIEYLAFIAGMPVDEFRARIHSMQERGLLKVEGPEALWEVQIDGVLKRILELTEEQANS